MTLEITFSPDVDAGNRIPVYEWNEIEDMKETDDGLRNAINTMLQYMISQSESLASAGATK